MATAVAPGRRSRSQTKLIGFALFALATVFVTYMKNARILDPASPIAQHFAPVRWYLIPHAFFGALAMAMGIFQFSNRLRARYLSVHRFMGYVYITSVFISAPLGYPIAKRIDDLSLAAASVAQAFGWIVTACVALYCVRNGNITQHRRWMIRSYAFAVVFTVARLIVPIPPILSMGLPGIEIVVWSTIAAAAFLPSIFLDWRSIVARPVSRAAAGD
jgi:uncharacterized membrane protein